MESINEIKLTGLSMSQPITVTDAEIRIQAQHFSTKDNSCINKEILQDILSNQYTGQHVVIEAHDGEHIRASGFLALMAEFSMIFKIPLPSILVETHDTGLESPFEFKYLPLGLFLGANKYISKFEHNLDAAKFVGTAIGRFTTVRLRLAYELDQAFPDDTYIIFQGRPRENITLFEDLYQKEMYWFTNKQFDLDVKTTSPIGAVGFDDAYRNYPNIWNQYQIEAVAETDPVSNFWFTEKTAKCLATGKPFVLVNGFKSLEKLRSMGFFTYDSVIDESYDEEPTPTCRINAIVQSLKELYNSTDKDKRIQQMYKVAQKNIDIYRQYVKDQGHDV
jgi:hypothetical protein